MAHLSGDVLDDFSGFLGIEFDLELRLAPQQELFAHIYREWQCGQMRLAGERWSMQACRAVLFVLECEHRRDGDASLRVPVRVLEWSV